MRECRQVYNNDYSKHACDSLYWCLMADLTGMQQPQQQQSVCGPAAHVSIHTCKPSGLLMVHAVLILTVKVWLCGMTRVYRVGQLK